PGPAAARLAPARNPSDVDIDGGSPVTSAGRDRSADPGRDASGGHPRAWRWTMKTLLTRRAILKGGLALGAGLGLGLRIPIGNSAVVVGAGGVGERQVLAVDREDVVPVVNLW